MGQAIKTEFICDGRYRIHSIKAFGRQRGRIIEIEDVDLQRRFHGTASKMEQMALKLRTHPLADMARFLRGGA